jgi:secreted Zn-dependent insulinase-like peptidase
LLLHLLPQPVLQALVDACSAALNNTPGGPCPLNISLAPPARITLAQPSQPSSSQSTPLSLPPLSLPGRNWALPVHVDLPPPAVPAAQEKQQQPALLVDTPALRMWHLPQYSWGIPKAHVYVHLVTPHVYLTSLDSWVAARLATRILDLRLAERVYDARVGGSDREGCTT